MREIQEKFNGKFHRIVQIRSISFGKTNNNESSCLLRILGRQNTGDSEADGNQSRQ